MKGTSVFGGVQIFQILINLIRGKFVALFLGPDGMGIASLFTTSGNTISRFASLGLNLSFVKEIAAEKDNPAGLAAVLKVANLLLQLTAVAGALFCALLAPWLSSLSFGSDAYSWQFVLLAVVIYLNVSGQAKLSILQGFHKVRLISLTSLIGALTGLVVGVPLYYFWGNAGIVPAMIVLGFSTWACYEFGVRKTIRKLNLNLPGLRLNRREHSPLARRMIRLGFILLISSLINTGCAYIINIFIRSFGNLADVGLFNAANSITAQYAGVVFTAMAMDYFPRLTAAAHDNNLMHHIVNRQLEIVALIATPLTIALIATTPLIIRLLLTVEFLPVSTLMRWLGLSILLKALAYPLGYITFAKDNQKLFFWLEAVVCNFLYIGCSLAGYYFFGLIGLGYGVVCEQFCCLILYLAVNRFTYSYHLSSKALAEIVWALAAGTIAFSLGLLINSLPAWCAMGALFLLVAGRSFVVLRRRLRAD